MVSDCHVWGAPECAFYVTGETCFWGCYGDWAKVNYHYILASPNINITDHSFIGSPNEGNVFNSTIFIQAASNQVRGHANLINYTNSANITPFNCFLKYFKGSIPAHLNLHIERASRKDNEIPINNSGGYFLPKDKWIKITTSWGDWPYPIQVVIGLPIGSKPHLIGYISITKYTFLGENNNNGFVLKK